MVPLRSTFHGKYVWGPETERFLVNLKGIGGTMQNIIPIVKKIYFLLCPFDTRFWRILESLYEKTIPLRIINRYAKFGTMSKWRGELVVEWSNDGITWRDYEFRYKPVDINKLPPVIPFHLPGLDWRIWFLPTPVLRIGIEALPDWYFSFLKVSKII